MKVRVEPKILEAIPGLCMGIVAVRAADNQTPNGEAEAFRHRCCTEANLLYKLNEHVFEKEIGMYRAALETMGIRAGISAFERTVREYEVGIAPLLGEGAEMVVFEELVGADALSRTNPISDMIRAAMLKFHVEIHGYDMGNRTKELAIQKNGEHIQVTLGDAVCTNDWMCEELKDGQITASTEDVCILITGFPENRKKVAAARNELARRMKSAFDRGVEAGWLEGKQSEFTAEI